jgi:hypothetical protein
MERHYNEDRLSAFFDGELPLSERSEMDALLRASPEMRRTLEDFQRQRDWLSAMSCPALSEGFANRVMDQVLAAAKNSAPAVPPPFPVRAKRRSFAIISAIALSTVATIVLGLFIANQLKKTDGDTVVKNDPPAGVVDPSTNLPDTEIPDTKINAQGNSTAIAATEPKSNEGENSSANKVPNTDPPATNIVDKGASEIPLIVKTEPEKNITDANSEMPSGSKTLASNIAKANPKATMKTRPKAYRVQIGTFSEFESRLKCDQSASRDDSRSRVRARGGLGDAAWRSREEAGVPGRSRLARTRRR